MKSSEKYLVPPKLQNKLLLRGITISELGIASILSLIGWFSGNWINAVTWTGMWLLFVARIFAGKSLAQILRTMISYHFIFPQQFIRCSQRRKKANEKIKH